MHSKLDKSASRIACGGGGLHVDVAGTAAATGAAAGLGDASARLCANGATHFTGAGYVGGLPIGRRFRRPRPLLEAMDDLEANGGLLAAGKAAHDLVRVALP